MKLEFRNLTKSFGPQRVLGPISLACEFSHCLTLLGPSGGGKSTLLRLIAGLETVSNGSISVDGALVPTDERALRAYRTDHGTVFQGFNLFPHLSALDNLLLPLIEVHGLSKSDATDRAFSVLKRFALADHVAKRPNELSGGQRQRIAIARAVAIQPAFLLFDEPTSALDPEMTGEVLDLISELKSENRTLIMVTHEMGFARSVADHILFLAAGTILESRPGRDFFSDPETPEAKRFLNRILKY